MMGRLHWRAISRTISSVNAPAWAETPASTVTLALRTTSSREMDSELESCQPSMSGAGAGKGKLSFADALAALDHQAVAIEDIEALAGLLARQALFFHGGDEQVGDASTRRSGAVHGNGLLAERCAGGIDGREEGGGGGVIGRGSLNVVVEGAEAVAVALEQTRGIVAGKVFPLQQDVRPAALDGRDEGLDKSRRRPGRARVCAASRCRWGR